MSSHLLLLTEIARIIGESNSLQGVLDRVVTLVAARMETDLCSIWLLDGSRTRLVLGASEGLTPESVGHATLEKGQGQTWQVLETQGPVRIEDAPKAPHYHYLPETHEEAFHSYLGIPLRVRGLPIGVLCVQTREPRSFHEDEVRALAAIGSQIAPVVDNARLLTLIAGGTERSEESGARPARGRRFFGTPCSTGIVAGELLRLTQRPPQRPRETRGAAIERTAIDEAFRDARTELTRMQEWLRERNAEEAALVFSVQLMFLEDRSFTGRMTAAVAAGATAHDAVRNVSADVLKRFADLDDVFFRERADDIRDLTARLLRILHRSDGPRHEPMRGRIVVLPELNPSRMVSLCAEGAAAVLTGGGGATSHAALLARSLDLPLVVGLGDFLHEVRNGQRALVDAASGEVVLDPPPALVRASTRAASESVEALRRLAGPDDGAALPIRLEANVSLWGDAVRARASLAEGVGLYRTEFAFLMRPDLPGEEEQYVLYRRIVEEIAPRPVTFRLLDAGGDKLVPALAQAPEPNPFLGYRSLRLLLEHPEILTAQVRAILHALEGSGGRLLVPMVGSAGEFDAVRERIESEGLPLPPLGAMIELPSALFQLEELAAAADFLCVGTNDLTQHLLGVDRTNARVTRYFDPFQPAVLRAIRQIVLAARAAGKPTTLCGEAASNPILLPVWIALGIERLSIHTTRLDILRALARRLDRTAADEALADILSYRTADQIRERLHALAPAEVRDWSRHR